MAEEKEEKVERNKEYLQCTERKEKEKRIKCRKGWRRCKLGRRKRRQKEIKNEEDLRLVEEIGEKRKKNE